jgi:hypothetical protein
MNLHKPNHDVFTHFVVFYDHEENIWRIDEQETQARYPEGNTCSTQHDPVLGEAEWLTSADTNANLMQELAELINEPKL